MRPHRRVLLVVLVVLALGAGASGPAAVGVGDLPERLTDQEFWRLTEELSEPSGFFRSDNLVSNEQVFARVVPDLISRTKSGGVYLGVGPEQNFTYIAAVRPKIAFIVDIRRGNLHLQLMYKALFELAADRADFLALLFTRTRPEGLTAESTATDLLQAYWAIPPNDEPAYRENLRALQSALVKKHALPLPADDLAGIENIYRAFYTHGPSITWSSGPQRGGGRGVTYASLMMQADLQGQGLSYLATEEKFVFLKDLEARNLVVPVVGDFGGPKAIRAVGSYLKQRGVTVTAFYLSNVEQYLRQDNKTSAFCHNVAALPLDDASVFIRPGGSSLRIIRSIPTPGTTATISTAYIDRGGGTALYPIAEEVKNCTFPAPVAPLN